MPEGGEPDVAADVILEIADRPGGDFVRVLLKAEGRVEQDGIEPRFADSRDQVLVDRRHHRSRFSRAENRDQPRKRGKLSRHTSMLRRSNGTPRTGTPSRAGRSD